MFFFELAEFFIWTIDVIDVLLQNKGDKRGKGHAVVYGLVGETLNPYCWQDNALSNYGLTHSLA